MAADEDVNTDMDDADNSSDVGMKQGIYEKASCAEGSKWQDAIKEGKKNCIGDDEGMGEGIGKRGMQ